MVTPQPQARKGVGAGTVTSGTRRSRTCSSAGAAPEGAHLGDGQRHSTALASRRSPSPRRTRGHGRAGPRAPSQRPGPAPPLLSLPAPPSAEGARPAEPTTLRKSFRAKRCSYAQMSTKWAFLPPFLHFRCSFLCPRSASARGAAWRGRAQRGPLGPWMVGPRGPPGSGSQMNTDINTLPVMGVERVWGGVVCSLQGQR